MELINLHNNNNINHTHESLNCTMNKTTNVPSSIGEH